MKIYNKLDKLWAEAVRKIDSNCIVCGKPSANAHHIFGRDNKSTRFDIANGIGLCVGCHTFNSKFSAHKTPRAFFRFLEEKHSKEWVDELEKKSVEVKQWREWEVRELELHYEELIKTL